MITGSGTVGRMAEGAHYRMIPHYIPPLAPLLPARPPPLTRFAARRARGPLDTLIAQRTGEIGDLERRIETLREELQYLVVQRWAALHPAIAKGLL